MKLKDHLKSQRNIDQEFKYKMLGSHGSQVGTK